MTEEIVTPILQEENLDLVDIEYVKEGKDFFLRIFIDKEGGVGLNECELVSEKLSEQLDQHDPIKGAYFLVVSSPGAERPLKTKADFEKHVNKNIYVSLYAPIDGEKEYEGILTRFEDDTATIEYKVMTRTKEVSIPFDKIAQARLAVVF